MTSRITDSLTGIALAGLLAVVGVGTERVYSEPTANVQTIAGLEQRVSRLEFIVSEGAGIRVEGGQANVTVNVPDSAEQIRLRSIENRTSERLARADAALIERQQETQRAGL